jgi:hypothetical protein
VSHCWGENEEVPRLTRSTYTHLKQGVPYSTIRLLNDVALIAQLAQVQYLWIDSLCILQDDSTDVVAEISRMADIYVNSFATIVIARSTLISTGVGWMSRMWTLQETLQTPRRFALGNYVLHSHGSDDFNQGWFYRMVTRTIRTEGTASPAATCRAFRSISCPHQDCDTFYVRLHGLNGSAFVDLPGNLPRELLEALKGGPCRDKAEHAADTRHCNDQELPPEPTEPACSVASVQTTGPPQPEDKKTMEGDVDLRAESLIKQGLQAFHEGQSLTAVGSFVQARERSSDATTTSPQATRIHTLTSIYLAAIYLRQGSHEMALSFVESSQVLLARHDVSNSVLYST